MTTPKGNLIFVHSARAGDGEQFFIDDSDATNHHGHVIGPLTETQFRDTFKSRGVSEQEIEDRVTAARMKS
jgi:hypothetical protein